MADMMTDLVMMPDDQFAATATGLGLDGAMMSDLAAKRAAVRGINAPPTDAPLPGIVLDPGGAGVVNANPMPPPAAPRPKTPGVDPSTLVVGGAPRQPMAQPQQPGGGVGVSGFGDISREAAASRKQAVAATKEGERMMTGAIDLEQQAAEESLAAARGRAAGELVAVQERNANMDAMAAQRAENEAKRVAVHDEEMKKYDQLVESARSHEEDPDRWYKSEDGSTNWGKKIGAAIAMALGQFSAAMLGGPNAAMTIIQDAIDKDIQAQRQAQRGRERDAEMQRTKLSDLREKFGDDRRAELALEDSYLASFERNMDETAARSKDEELLANYAQSKAAIQQRRAEVKTQFAQQTEAITQRGLALEADVRTRANTARIQVAELNARRGGGNVAADLAARGLALKPGAQPREQDITKASEIKTQSNKLGRTLDRLLALRREYGSETLPTAAKKEMQVLSSDLAIAYKELGKLGAISGTDKEMIDKVIPEDASAFGFVEDQLVAARSQIGRSVAASLDAYGMQEIDESPASFKER